MIFLFTTNNSESIISYIAALKSGNAVLLLDEKLNEEIRNGLIENYKPDFIISSNSISPELYSLVKYESLNFLKRKQFNKYFPWAFGSFIWLLVQPVLLNLLGLLIKTFNPILNQLQTIYRLTKPKNQLQLFLLNYSYGLSVINSHLLKELQLY